MNNKGNILDWFFILALLLMCSLCIFIAFMIVTTVDSSEAFAAEPDAQYSINKAKETILSFDSLFIFVIVGLSISVLISSAIVFNHPAFFFCSVFLLFIAITVGATVSNVFWKFRTSETIAATAANFPKIVYLMEHIPFYVLFLGMASCVVMYLAYQRT